MLSGECQTKDASDRRSMVNTETINFIRVIYTAFIGVYYCYHQWYGISSGKTSIRYGRLFFIVLEIIAVRKESQQTSMDTHKKALNCHLRTSAF